MVGMLSNRIWNMPTATRSEAPGTATIYFRCGSQQGKPAKSVASDLPQEEFDGMTVEFLSNEISAYLKARAAKQKNASRNLKKYLDADDIRSIEDRGGELAVEDVAKLL
jgi:hypothetical protein